MAAGNQGVLMQRSRWMALFVALALVGVLLAAQGTPSTSTTTRNLARPTSQAALGQRARTTVSDSTSAIGSPSAPQLHPLSTPATALRSTKASTSSVLPMSGSTAVTDEPLANRSTTTTAPVTTTTTTLNLSPTIATPVRVESGWLSAPTSVSASYAIDASADATVKFVGALALTLAATCPSGTQSVAGPSPLALIGLAAGCWLTISGPSSLPTTTYELRLTPR